MLGLAMACGSARADDGAPIVRTTQGAIHGKTVDGLDIFKGVPFAAPPVGPRRWQKPAPLKPWTGVRDALNDAPPCAQGDRGWNTAIAAISSEDCLYLNIWVPKGDRQSSLPVMVYFPGGAQMGGWARGDTAIEPPYDGARLASHGVIVVTAGYRVGLFGFLAHPELSAESPDHSSGNYALYDIIAALRWIRENIARFGGNPGNVTAFGHSAGSWNLGTLMTSPLGKGLFARAILQSNSVVDGGVDDVPRLPEAEAEGRKLAAKLGAPETGAIAALRARSAKDLLDMLGRHDDRDGPTMSTVIVDGHVLPDIPGAVYRAGHELPIPIIIGNAARDGDIPNMGVKGSPKARAALADATRPPAQGAVAPLTAADAAAIRAFYDADPDPDLARKALALYRGETTTDPGDGERGVEFFTDIIFRCGARLVASWHRRHAATWEYQFSHGYEPLGAVHLWDQQFVFGTMIPPADQPAHHALSEAVETYWTNFARTGNPNGAGEPAWPQVDDAQTYLDFATGGPTVKAGLRPAACALFRHRIETALDARALSKR